MNPPTFAAIVQDLQELDRASGKQVVSFAPKVYRGLSGQEESKPFLSAPK